MLVAHCDSAIINMLKRVQVMLATWLHLQSAFSIGSDNGKRSHSEQILLYIRRSECCKIAKSL
jgi:hypothetical protein